MKHVTAVSIRTYLRAKAAPPQTHPSQTPSTTHPDSEYSLQTTARAIYSPAEVHVHQDLVESQDTYKHSGRLRHHHRTAEARQRVADSTLVVTRTTRRRMRWSSLATSSFVGRWVGGGLGSYTRAMVKSGLLRKHVNDQFGHVRKISVRDAHWSEPQGLFSFYRHGELLFIWFIEGSKADILECSLR